MVSPHPRARLRALAFAGAASLAFALLTGCGSQDDADSVGTGSPSGNVAKGGSGAQAGSAGSGGQSGASGTAGGAGQPDTDGGLGEDPVDDPRGGAGTGGSGGSDPDKSLTPPGYAGSDAGYCNPTLVVMLPVPADGASDQVAKVQVHADTTSDLLGVATNRYEAVCGESGGDDLLIGLDVPETGNLTLSLAAASKGFQGVLSVERGVCKGTLGAADGCAVAEVGGVAQLSLVVKKGEHLFVFVDSPAGRGGEFNLVATLVPSP